jgi:hypothetical protein|tara:strand:+ start:205 stop:354 length:150 start_codon:yes stop_codon:yes gene_type:complete
MNKILNIIEQVEQGKITAEESVKLIKATVLDIQEDELLDYVFPTKKFKQ